MIDIVFSIWPWNQIEKGMEIYIRVYVQGDFYYYLFLLLTYFLGIITGLVTNEPYSIFRNRRILFFATAET